jgi:hypothetical protein
MGTGYNNTLARGSRRWNENSTAASKGSGWQTIIQDNDVFKPSVYFI